MLVHVSNHEVFLARNAQLSLVSASTGRTIDVEIAIERFMSALETATDVVDLINELAPFYGISPRRILKPKSSLGLYARKVTSGLCVVWLHLSPLRVAEIFGAAEQEVRFSAGEMKARLGWGRLPEFRGARELIGSIADRIVAPSPTIRDIQQSVGRLFRISVQDMIYGGKRDEVRIPRQVAISLCRRLTKRSLKRIGERFGGRDHTTIHHSAHRAFPVLEAVKPSHNTLEAWIGSLKANRSQIVSRLRQIRRARM